MGYTRDMRALTALGTLMATILIAALLCAATLAPLAGLGGIAVARTQQTMEEGLADLSSGAAPGVTTIYDAQGNVLTYLYDQRRYEVTSAEISHNMKDAIVAIEDKRFYEHDGVDWTGTLRAMGANLLSGSVQQSASTLDQQYVKNYLYLIEADDEAEAAAAVETSYARKLREMKMASELDKTLTKDEILTRYLNLVPFGNGAFGVEAAARTYFGTSARELTIPQAALLAGLVQSTTTLDPYTNPEGALDRRNTVLQTMGPDVYSRYAAEPLGVLEAPDRLSDGCIITGDAGFFCDYVLAYLAAKGFDEDRLTSSSFEIHTTLDPDIQARIKNSLNASPSTVGVSESLDIVEPSPTSRNILAMVSSRAYGLDEEQGQTVLPLTSTNIGAGAGSVFKIFTAATAIKEGMGIDTQLSVPARVEKYGMGTGGADGCPPGAYCVTNSGNYAASMSLRDALAFSPNTAFVNLIEQVGVDDVVDMAVDLGLRSYERAGSYDGETSIAAYVKDNNLGSFTLGPMPVNPLELSNVAATLAAGGVWCEPTPIVSITERGNPIRLKRPACERVLPQATVTALNTALSQDTVKGTGMEAAQAAGWTAPTAAKTGTTESHTSAAFLGYNSAFAAATYVFNDGPTSAPLCTSPLRQCQWGDLYGGDEPARAWIAAASTFPTGTLPQMPAATPPRTGTGSAGTDTTGATGTGTTAGAGTGTGNTGGGTGGSGMGTAAGAGTGTGNTGGATGNQ